MSSQIDRLSTQSLEQATEWYWTIREPDVSNETITEWQSWLSAAPENRKAFSRIELVMAAVDSTESPTWPTGEEMLADQYDGSVSINEWQTKSKESKPEIEGKQFRSLYATTSSKVWAVAASLFIVIGIAVFFQSQNWSDMERQPDYALYQTQPSEHREVLLPDGSKIVLGGKSTVSVAYNQNKRMIILQNGEAFFNVVKDKKRPFIVEASGRDITAIGTAFNVSKQNARVVVTVTEGIVVVSPEESRKADNLITTDEAIDKFGDIARLEVGQKLVYSDQIILPISIADTEDAVAWRDGVLKYRGEPLQFVVEDLRRYIDYPIVLGDAKVGELQITGTVFQNNASDWVFGLPKAFPVVVSESKSGIVVKMKPEHR